jgi:tmRNA-binding protein
MVQLNKKSSEIANNKKALFDYEILEEHEAGIELF